MKKCPVCKNELKQLPEKKLTKQILLEALKFLIPREYAVIYFRVALKGQLQEVGKKFGCTRERIRQIEVKAFRRLKKWFKYHLDFDVDSDAICELMQSNPIFWPFPHKLATERLGFFEHKEETELEQSFLEDERKRRDQEFYNEEE